MTIVLKQLQPIIFLFIGACVSLISSPLSHVMVFFFLLLLQAIVRCIFDGMFTNFGIRQCAFLQHLAHKLAHFPPYGLFHSLSCCLLVLLHKQWIFKWIEANIQWTVSSLGFVMSVIIFIISLSYASCAFLVDRSTFRCPPFLIQLVCKEPI